ncbi:MAG: protoheme IX farnesyltransferase [Geobacter sp.]|nr:protoheme IX farnesyltransferase [Geobacter sp.]
MKPGIVAAVMLAGCAGMATGAHGLPEAGRLFACLAALFLAASGAAILNNVLDAEADRLMLRLAKRSAALERIGKKRAAAVAGAAIVISLWIAAAFVNPLTAFLLLAAVLSYTPLYTLLLKRRSPHGAVPGGLAGALPVLIGSAAANAALNREALILFTLMLLWQPPHFWTLALQYRDDYQAAGIPVLPVVRGVAYTKSMVLIFAAVQLLVTFWLGIQGDRSAWFAAISVILALLFLSVCAWNVAIKDRYRRGFAASLVYLVLLLISFIADSFLPA